MNPWHPMSDPVDLKTLGKLCEELGECSAAAARCLIQGIDEREPRTGKPNRRWLSEELADVLANVRLTVDHFGLDQDFILSRADAKRAGLQQWRSMA